MQLSSSPRDIDIILGKGGTGRYHPGNIFLRQQLTPMQIYYQKMERPSKKSELVDNILKLIVASGRHFYKKDKESKKFRIVGLDEKFPDGHLMIRNKILNILSAKITSTTATTAALAAAAVDVRGHFIYLQTMKNGYKKGHLRMNAPVSEKALYRDMLSEAKDVLSQLNIDVDPTYQLYVVRGLHNTPHSVEDNCKRDQCVNILQQHYGATITEMRHHCNGNGVEVVDGKAANYTSSSPILQQLVNTALPSKYQKELAEYINTNGTGNPNRDVGAGSKRVYIGFGQVQSWSQRFKGEKMPTFNYTHLQQMPAHLQLALAEILSFAQSLLNEQFPSVNNNDQERKEFVRSMWQQHYKQHNVEVDWTFEFVDINMRCPGDGKLLRHCDYKNDHRVNNDGCAVFSYSVSLFGQPYRVVIVMTSRYAVGAPFEKIEAKKSAVPKAKSVVSKAKKSTKQCIKKRRYQLRRK